MTATGLSALKSILRIKDYRLLSGIILIAFGVFNGLVTWIQKILHDLHHLSLLETGKTASILMLSGVIGCLVIPFISDKIRRRKPFLFLALGAGILSLAALIWIRNPVIIRLDAILLGFFLLSGLPIVFSLSIAITGPKRAGISIGFFGLSEILLPCLLFRLRANSVYGPAVMWQHWSSLWVCYVSPLFSIFHE